MPFVRVLFPQKYLIYAVLWSFSGDGRLKMRAELGEYIRRITTVTLPAAPNVPIIDYEVQLILEYLKKSLHSVTAENQTITVL